MIMKKINFNDPATFEKLEHMAYENTLDYTDFPPAEYKYFDKLSQLGSIYRSGQLPKGLCKERKDAYLCDYRKDADKTRKKSRGRGRIPGEYTKVGRAEM